MFTIEAFVKNEKFYAQVISNNLNLDNKDYEYAFYLYKDNTRVNVIWYDNRKDIYFDIEGENGVYYVKCFARAKNKDSLMTYNSRKISKNILPYDVSKWNRDLFEYNLNDLEEKIKIKNGIHQISIENQKIDFLFDNIEFFDKNKGILVCFSGSVPDRNYKYAPFFSGLSIAKKMKMPVISIADPSLSMSNELPLAWYAGNKNLKNLPQIIAHILDIFSMKLDSKLVLFGGSGGGFATLAVINYMNTKGTGVVWNPQTSISEYDRKAVSNYIETCILKDTNINNFYSILEKEEIIHDLSKIYCEDKENRILYIQNIGDNFHVKKHAEPFMKNIKAKKENDFTFTSEKGITFWLKYWGDGHIAPSGDLILKVLDNLISNDSPLEVALSLK